VTRALAASPHLAHDHQPAARAKAKNGTTPSSIVTSTTIAAGEGKPDAVSQLGAIADHNTAPANQVIECRRPAHDRCPKTSGERTGCSRP
jgi:hypothetical protein